MISLPKAPFKNQPYFLQFLILLLVIFSSSLFILLAGILAGVPFFGKDILDNINEMSNPDNPAAIPLLKYLQIISQVGMFILPPLIFAWMVSYKPFDYLGFSRKPLWYSILASGIIIIASLPVIDVMIRWNEMLHLPEWLRGVENWIKKSETDAGKLTDAFLKTASPGGFMVNLLMIGVLPAIGEEFLFRGALLKLLKNWTHSCHWAIIISAIVFSAFHLQFYGFLPRMMLGILFGYLLFWSGSLWIPVFAHFINNAYAVVTAYYVNTGSGDTLANPQISSSVWLVVLSLLLLTGLLLSVYYTERNRKTY